MNWHDRDCFDPTYFSDICTALKQRTFLQPASSQTSAEQLGRWIVEPADRFLETVIAEKELPASAEQAIAAFELAIEHFPTAVTQFFRDHAGDESYKGLFCSRHIDIYSMWGRIAKRTHSHWVSDENWLNQLACALLRDTDFSDKLDEAHECCRLGMSRRDTLARIEEHHRALHSPYTSAKSLLVLDL